MQEIKTIFFDTLGYIAQGDKRIFWAFLLSSALIALWHSYKYQYADSLKQAISKAWQPQHYFNRSTLLDLSLLLSNNTLRVLLVIPVIGSQLGVAIAVHKGLYHGLGDSPNWSLDGTLLISLFTLCFFIADDFTRFILHYAMHRFTWLWKIHSLHHNAETLTPLTLYRFNPLEMVLLSLRSVLTGGMVSGFFVYCFDGRISSVDILGANAFGFIFNACAANLRHSHVPLSFGKLEHWFISPAQHQIHHSSAKNHWNKNMGSCLAIWDRLAKTWIPGSNTQQLKFGIKD